MSRLECLGKSSASSQKQVKTVQNSVNCVVFHHNTLLFYLHYAGFLMDYVQCWPLQLLSTILAALSGSQIIHDGAIATVRVSINIV